MRKTYEELRKEADSFFEFPDESCRYVVTFVSAVLFARYILEKYGGENESPESISRLNNGG
jgi:hypothetical protein